MMRKILVLAILMLGICALFPVRVVAADWEDPICSKFDPTSDEYKAANCGNTETIFSKIPGVVTAIFTAVGFVAVAMIVFGGVRYTTSQGDAGKVKKAKDTIMYAVIGLIVTLSAFAITAFILGAFS